MANNTENLVLKHLHALRKELGDTRHEMCEFRSTAEGRLAAIEQK